MGRLRQAHHKNRFLYSIVQHLIMQNTLQISEREEDAALVRRCCAHDPAAQKMLYDRYKNRMMAFCRRYFQRQDLAEDFFQEGFIRFFQKIDQYDPQYPLYPYMKKIFLRAGINYLQQFFSKQYDTDGLTEASDIATLPPQELPGISYDELIALIRHLPTADATILQLSLIESWTHEEIALTLNITEGHSRIRLLRARKKLIQLLESRYESPKTHTI
jgi:RNA polymerase sigma factor (sigma-70 family)